MGESQAPTTKEDYYLIKSVVKAINALWKLSAASRPLGATELSAQLGYSRTVCYKLLCTLTRCGLTHFDHASKKYTLSPKVVELASSFLESSPLVRVSFSHIRRLAEDTNMSSGLAVLWEGTALFLIDCESRARVRVRTPVGLRSPLHASSSGKCLLAFLPKQEQSEVLASLVLEKHTSATITEHDVLRRELDQVREEGYAVNKGERVADLYGIAAPVFDSSNRLVAAASIGIPSSSISEDEITDLAGMVVDAANRITEELAPYTAALSSDEAW